MMNTPQEGVLSPHARLLEADHGGGDRQTSARQVSQARTRMARGAASMDVSGLQGRLQLLASRPGVAGSKIWRVCLTSGGQEDSLDMQVDSLSDCCSSSSSSSFAFEGNHGGQGRPGTPESAVHWPVFAF